uniref:Uncharacterized protein n=1 Tax=Lepeophtheirus salmonis TaxID=72036 RepID=A0A0K2UT30_LEPSM
MIFFNHSYYNPLNYLDAIHIEK